MHSLTFGSSAALGRAMRQMTAKSFELGALNRRRLRDVGERTISDEFDSQDASEKDAKRPSDDVVQTAPVKCRWQ
jgi:hypothetical protein